MTSITLLRRLSAVVLMTALILWLVTVIAAYFGNNWEEESFRPSPERLASIVELMENVAPSQRAAILDALAAPILSLRIVEPTDKPQPDDAPREVDEELAKRYAGALAGHAFTVAKYLAPISTKGLMRFSGQRRLVFEFHIGLKTGETLVVINTAPVISTRLGLPIGLGGGLIGSIVALVVLLTLYNEIKPLSALARAVDRIDLTSGPVPLPAAKRQSAEIKALIHAFDRLQARLLQLMRSRMVLIAGISHDVRTFATRLRLRIDAIPDEDSRERAARDISDMIAMLDDALLAARFGAGDINQELLDFASLVHDEAEARRSLAIPVEIEQHPKDGEAMILGDRLALRRMIGNLLDNAVKYGKAAFVSTIADGKAVLLVVEDNGPGPPGDIADLLTEPFVRGESSRNRGTGGAGLGLAIAKNVVEAHDGTLAIGRAAGRGARLEVRIPLYEL